MVKSVVNLHWLLQQRIVNVWDELPPNSAKFSILTYFSQIGFEYLFTELLQSRLQIVLDILLDSNDS